MKHEGASLLNATYTYFSKGICNLTGLNTICYLMNKFVLGYFAFTIEFIHSFALLTCSLAILYNL